MPRYLEWCRRTRRGKPPDPWEIDGEVDGPPDDDQRMMTHPQWEYVVLPDGEHPDPRQVPGRKHELGGES